MGLYNMLFGTNPVAPVILAALDLTAQDVGRFRDAFVSDGKIAVYTRNGGGNRECWNDGQADCSCPGCIIEVHLPRHPYYLRDEDDDFDHTYATIYFRFPPEHAELLSALDGGTFDPSKRWGDMLAALAAGKRPEVERAIAPILEGVAERLK